MAPKQPVFILAATCSGIENECVVSEGRPLVAATATETGERSSTRRAPRAAARRTLRVRGRLAQETTVHISVYLCSANGRLHVMRVRAAGERCCAVRESLRPCVVRCAARL